MNNAAKLGAGVAGGYLLGRTKKLKLAIGLGAWMMGKRLNLSPTQLAMQGFGQLKDTPEFLDLTERLRGEVGGAGRRAISAVAMSRMDSLADRLHDRNNGIAGSEEDEYEDDEYDDEQDDELRDEQDEGDEEDEEDYDDQEDYDEEDEYDEAEDEAEDEDEDEDEEDDEPQSRQDETDEMDEPYPEEERPARSRSGSRSGSRGGRR